VENYTIHVIGNGRTRFTYLGGLGIARGSSYRGGPTSERASERA